MSALLFINERIMDKENKEVTMSLELFDNIVKTLVNKECFLTACQVVRAVYDTSLADAKKYVDALRESK